MKENIVRACIVGATGVSMALAGAGVATADTYAGQTYADASSALSGASLKGVIATRVGGALPDGQCVSDTFGEGPLDQREQVRGRHRHSVAVLELQRHGGVGHLARELGGKPGRQGSHCGSERGRSSRPGDGCGQPEPDQEPTQALESPDPTPTARRIGRGRGSAVDAPG